MVEFSEGEQIGWMDTDTFGAYWSCPAVPSGTTITPTESSQTIGGYGYMMEGAVTVSAISSSYVGSGITRRNSTDLSASGATVTVPEGFYASQTTKSVGTAVLEGDSSITVTPVITVENGVITASVSTTSAISPVYTSGYYDSSRTVNVAVTGSATATAPSGGSASIATVTTTNSSDQNTSISFTLPSGRTPKAFFVRLTSQIARSSSYRYYFVENVRWDGSSSGGFAGRCFYRYNGTLTNVTSGYSKSQSGTTFTLSSTGSRSASPGSFYNGTYEMVYVY